MLVVKKKKKKEAAVALVIVAVALVIVVIVIRIRQMPMLVSLRCGTLVLLSLTSQIATSTRHSKPRL